MRRFAPPKQPRATPSAPAHPINRREIVTEQDMGNFSCPFCHETELDAPGLIGHLDQWCDDAAKAREQWDEEMHRQHNADVLRMQARQLAEEEEREEQEREEMRLDLRDDEQDA
jgi:hypothetical protein